jgi:hypothetical protein
MLAIVHEPNHYETCCRLKGDRTGVARFVSLCPSFPLPDSCAVED